MPTDFENKIAPRRIWWPHLLIFALIAAVIMVIYKDLPRAPFFLDDYLHLHLIQRIKNPFEPFVVDIFMGAFFRPAITLFWKLDYLISGLNASGYYISNLIYLMLSAALLYLLVQQLTGHRSVSAISTLFYVINPVTGVGVMWLSNRFDLIGATLFLASTLFFVLFIRYKRRRDYALSIVLGTTAYFCKEITITLPAILILATGFMFLYRAPQKFSWRLIRRLLFYSTPFFTLAALYMLWRFALIKSLGGYEGEVKAQLTLGYFLYVWQSFAEYFWLMKNFVAFGAVVFVIALLLVKKNFYASNKYLFFGLAFGLITTLPLLLIIRYQNVISFMTPRFFFLPNIGLTIALVSVYDPRSGRARRMIAGVLLVLLGLFLALNNFILLHKWVRDKRDLVKHMEQVDTLVKAGLPGNPKEALVYSCLHNMDVALDTSIKLMHPEFINRYYFLNCVGPTQTIAEHKLYDDLRRDLVFPRTFSRNPCQYENLYYGVVDARPDSIPSQVSAANNVMVLHLDRFGRMTILHRDKVLAMLKTLGLIQ